MIGERFASCPPRSTTTAGHYAAKGLSISLQLRAGLETRAWSAGLSPLAVE